MLPRLVFALVLFAAAPVFAQGKDLAIDAFFGVFSGAGVSESNEAPGGKATMRDTVLEIGRAHV